MMFDSKQCNVNGLNYHYLEQGNGPLVLLCHGFPETSYSWRHQISFLANAGYRVIAPDLRGYGKTDSPQKIEDYSLLSVVGDLVALQEHLAVSSSIIIGNDWGATIAWQAARLRPDRFSAVAAFGVPMMARPPSPPMQLFPNNDDISFYIHYLCDSNKAANDLSQDVRSSLLKIYYWASKDAGSRQDPRTPNPFGILPQGVTLLDNLPVPPSLPSWMNEKDFDVLVRIFEESGFQSGINYYRNLDLNWSQEAAFFDKKIKVPALFLVGQHDTGLAIPGMDRIIKNMPSMVTNLIASKIIPNAGHWLQQEVPDIVNKELISFLSTVKLNSSIGEVT